MGVLTEIPSYRICTDKGRFDINPAFDIILEVQRLYKEESLTDYEKIQQALSMLIRNRWNLRLLKPVEQLKLMDYVPYDLYPAYLDEGEWVLTKEEADVLRSYGGLEGMIGMIDRSAPSVNVSVQGQSKDFDYEKFGRATVDAMLAAGIGFKCDDREFARLIKDLIDYV